MVAAAAGLDIALGARVSPALAVVAPLVAFLTAALTLSALIAGSGLADRAAVALADAHAATASRSTRSSAASAHC